MARSLQVVRFVRAQDRTKPRPSFVIINPDLFASWQSCSTESVCLEPACLLAYLIECLFKEGLESIIIVFFVCPGLGFVYKSRAAS